MFPAPLDRVARVRLSSLTKQTVGYVAVDVLWRELLAFQNVATPRLATAISPDGYGDDITVSGTEGLPGTLSWTLFGPTDPGPGGSCADASWSGAPVFSTDTTTVAGDGMLTVRPAAAPAGAGCYSYAVTVGGQYYTAAAVSAAGSPSETFSVAATTSTVATGVPPSVQPTFAPTTRAAPPTAAGAQTTSVLGAVAIANPAADPDRLSATGNATAGLGLAVLALVTGTFFLLVTGATRTMNHDED